MTIVGVTGHQRIPRDAITFVQEGIADVIRRFGSELAGVSSLAAGADQLFAETMLSSGVRLHVIIPCRGYESTFLEKASLEGFLDLLKRAAIVETLDHAGPSEDAFLDAGRRVVELSDLVLAVWDGQGAKGKGGTADIVRYAREHGTEVLVLWPPGVTR